MFQASDYSILRGITRADIRHEPYVHVVVEDCLSAPLYEELARTFPSDETVLGLGKSAPDGRARPNSRHDVHAQEILRNPDCFSPSWREFVRHHVSNAFFQELLGLMGPEILATYPELERRLGRPCVSCGPPFAALRSGWQRHRAGLPYWHQHTVRQPRQCEAGAYRCARRVVRSAAVFRAADDRVAGGHLEIFQWKRNKAHLFVGSEVDESDAEPVHAVAYKPNTAVIFINSTIALHAVSARDPSPMSGGSSTSWDAFPTRFPKACSKRSRRRAGGLSVAACCSVHRIAAGRF